MALSPLREGVLSQLLNPNKAPRVAEPGHRYRFPLGSDAELAESDHPVKSGKAIGADEEMLNAVGTEGTLWLTRKR